VKITITIDDGIMQRAITMIPDDVPEKVIVAGAFMIALKKGEVAQAKLALSMAEQNYRADETWYHNHCNVAQFDPTKPLFTKTPLEQAIENGAEMVIGDMKRVKKRAVRGLTLIRPQPITDADADRGNDCEG
jgi:hypothetical protein